LLTVFSILAAFLIALAISALIAPVAKFIFSFIERFVPRLSDTKSSKPAQPSIQINRICVQRIERRSLILPNKAVAATTLCLMFATVSVSHLDSTQKTEIFNG